jgi:hypothetical protein
VDETVRVTFIDRRQRCVENERKRRPLANRMEEKLLVDETYYPINKIVSRMKRLNLAIINDQ